MEFLRQLLNSLIAVLSNNILSTYVLSGFNSSAIASSTNDTELMTITYNKGVPFSLEEIRVRYLSTVDAINAQIAIEDSQENKRFVEMTPIAAIGSNTLTANAGCAIKLSRPKFMLQGSIIKVIAKTGSVAGIPINSVSVSLHGSLLKKEKKEK